LSGYGDDVFVHHESIATNSALVSAATWEYSGASFSLSSASEIKNAGRAWTGVTTYASGACPLPATAPSTTVARSGDYSGAQTDPNLKTFWLAGERATTISGSCQWETEIGKAKP